MGFLRKLFGKRKSQPPPGAVEPGKRGELIRVYDAYGREVEVTKQAWRDGVLLGTLEKERENPEQLYGMIAMALDDGFASDVLPYAEHLQTIDPNLARGATLLGVVYLALNRLDDAEHTLSGYVERHGEEAYVLSNLAKVYSKRGDAAKADATLWRSLELDPNQENALGVYWAEARERGGEPAGLEALRKVAKLPASWRAQLWLARNELEVKQFDAALRLYDDALKAAPRPVPIAFLMQMSGDLGNHGQLVELLKRTTPLFDVAAHGLMVGNNLIKANVDLGRLDHARAIVDRLYALKRPDFQQTLAFWDNEIAKARVAGATSPLPAPLSLKMLSFQGPIWLPPGSPAASLFAGKDPEAVVVCFLGSTLEKQEVAQAQLQLADAPGRFVRAVPLFLCEQLHLRTDAAGQTMQPWIAPGSFALFGKPWETELAIDQAKACRPAGDYLVISHLDLTAEPHVLSFRLLRAIDGSLLGSGSCPIDLARPEPLLEFAEQMLMSICQHAAVERVTQGAAYRVPGGANFGDYLLRIEQTLAVRASAGAPAEFLSGERELISGILHLCLREPDNPTPRIVLLESLRHAGGAAADRGGIPRQASDARSRPPPERARRGSARQARGENL